LGVYPTYLFAMTEKSFCWWPR